VAVTVALDTNRYVDLCKGIVETVAVVEEAEAVMLPFVCSVSFGPALPMAGEPPKTNAFYDASS